MRLRHRKWMGRLRIYHESRGHINILAELSPDRDYHPKLEIKSAHTV